VALLEGELGAGKTRLVDDFARWVAAGGGLVLRATAREAGSAVPFGVAADVMRAALDAPGVAGASGEWLSEIARLVPALRERLPGVPVPPLPANGEGWRLYEAVAQLLLALAGEQPVLVVVDDLPWADAESVALLRFVVERLPATPVLWCATATHGSADRDAPGRRLTRALRAAPDALVLELGPLAEGDVWELLRDLGRLPDTTAARGFARLVHAETAGTPQYVLALVEALLASGEVAHAADGSWVLPSDPLWTPADAMRAAPSARASVLARMERLPDDAREVLRAIAVADGWCSAPLLSEVLSVSRLRAASLGDALVERGLVTEAAGEYRCAHPVVARVVRDATSTAWRREMHRALALALGAPSGGDVLPDSGLAWHAAPAGDRGAARPPAPLPDRVAALAPAPPGTPA
jgi:predicted ATPase